MKELNKLLACDLYDYSCKHITRVNPTTINGLIYSISNTIIHRFIFRRVKIDEKEFLEWFEKTIKFIGSKNWVKFNYEELLNDFKLYSFYKIKKDHIRRLKDIKKSCKNLKKYYKIKEFAKKVLWKKRSYYGFLRDEFKSDINTIIDFRHDKALNYYKQVPQAFKLKIKNIPQALKVK